MHPGVVGPGVGSMRGGPGGVEGDGHAVAAEAGDDGHLIAEAEDVGWVGGIGRVDEAVGDAEDGGGAVVERSGGRETAGKMRHGADEVGGDAGPVGAGSFEDVARNKQAQVGAAVFNRLQAGIAAGEEDDLNVVFEVGGLGGGEAEEHLQADKVLRAPAAFGAAQVVLAGGEQDAAGLEFAEAIDEEAARGDLADGTAADDRGANRGGTGKDRLVEYAAGQAGALAGQRRAGNRGVVDEANGGDRGGAEGSRVDAEGAEGRLRLPTDELATDFVVRQGFALDQGGALAEVAGGRSPGKAAAGDQSGHFRRETQYRNGTCQRIWAAPDRPARSSRRCQSARRKLRATLMGPSWRTKRCQPARPERSWKP